MTRQAFAVAFKDFEEKNDPRLGRRRPFKFFLRPPFPIFTEVTWISLFASFAELAGLVSLLQLTGGDCVITS